MPRFCRGDDVAGIFIDMKAKPLPPLDYLDKCFEISEKSPSGLLWRYRDDRSPQWNGRRAGTVAGWIKTSPTKRRSWMVNINYSMWQVHRIIYSMINKTDIPEDVEIDHINTDALDNSISNLRLASHSDNAKNVAVRSDNSSGFKGVGWSSTGKYWWGEVVCKGERYRVRGCPTPEKAHELLCEIRAKLHKEFTHHG